MNKLQQFCTIPLGMVTGLEEYTLLKINDKKFTKYKCMESNRINTTESSTTNRINTTESSTTNRINTTESSTTAPTRHDTLFWCIYIMMYGVDQYEFGDRSAFTIEKKTKFEMIERIRINNDALKAVGINSTEVIDTILNQRRIDIIAAYAIVHTYELNVIFEFTHTFIRNTNKIDNVHIISPIDVSGARKYKIINADGTDVVNTKYEITDLKKPIKGFSVYSLPDLQSFAEKVGIKIYTDSGKKKTKRVLYDDISHRIIM